jgi:hypothetical protein
LLITVIIEEILGMDVFDEFLESLERDFGVGGGREKKVAGGVAGGLQSGVESGLGTVAKFES